jgi:CAAX protease family protein
MRTEITPVRPGPFFALTFLLSWLIWIPLALAHFEIGPFRIAEGTSTLVRLFGVLMPATAALILTARAGGRSAIAQLLGRLALWRVGWPWWLAVVAVQPILLVITTIVYNALGGQPAIVPLSFAVDTFIVNAIFLALATLGEEIGWHGVALPALQAKRSPLISTIILGLLMATWHLPFWLLMDSFDQFGVGYLGLNYLFVLPLTLYVTWFFNLTQSSILLAAVFHWVFNLVNVAWLPVTAPVGAFGLLIVFEWVIAIIILPRVNATIVIGDEKNGN